MFIDLFTGRRLGEILNDHCSHMRVAIVTESFLPRINGVTNSVIRIAGHLRRRGHEVVIICPDSYLAEHFDGIPVRTVRSVSLPGVADIDVFVGTRDHIEQLLQEFNPDVVHLASPFILGRAAAKAVSRLGIPCVAVFQTDVAGFANHYRLSAVASLAEDWLRRIHSGVDVTLAPSRASISYLEEIGVPRVRHWGRGVDLDLFNPLHRDVTLFEESRVVIGYVGRLAPEKNVAILQHIHADPRVQLVIIGDGPQREELRALLPNAVMTGRLMGTDLGRHVASLDVLVAPGEHETFCQVIQEGLAAGLPVVAPAAGGPLDLIEPAWNGVLYTPGDAADFIRKIEPLISDAALRNRLGQAARLSVAQRSWEAISDQLIAVYGDVLRNTVRLAS